jgi:hypothetical protein
LAHAFEKSLQRNFISRSTEGIFLYTNSATSVSAYPITCSEFDSAKFNITISNKDSALPALLWLVIDEELEGQL